MEKKQIEQYIQYFKQISQGDIEKRFNYEQDYICQLYGCLPINEKQELKKKAEIEENLVSKCRNLGIQLPSKWEQIGLPTYAPDIKGFEIHLEPKDFNKLNKEVNELITQIDLNCNNGKISIEVANSLKEDISFYYSYFESKVDINNKDDKVRSIALSDPQLKLIGKLYPQMCRFKKLVDLGYDSEHIEMVQNTNHLGNGALDNFSENISKFKHIEQIIEDRIVQLKQEYAQSSGKKKAEISQQLNDVNYIAEQIYYDSELAKLKNSNLPHEQYKEQKNEAEKNFMIAENSYLERKKIFLTEKFNYGKMYRSEYQQALQELQKKIDLNYTFLSEYEEQKNNSTKK